MCKLDLQRKRSPGLLLLRRIDYHRLRRDTINLDDFIIACFCLIDDALPTIFERKACAQPKTNAQAAVTVTRMIEVVGTCLGLSQDKALYDYFRWHYAHFFPELGQVHRTSFVRQAGNLWGLKECVWCLICDQWLHYDERGSAWAACLY